MLTGSHSQTISQIIDPQLIYEQYLQAFKKGVYNYIKEEPDSITGQSIPRKYFSGGVAAERIAPTIIYRPLASINSAQLPLLGNLVDVDGDFAMNSADGANGQDLKGDADDFRFTSERFIPTWNRIHIRASQNIAGYVNSVKKLFSQDLRIYFQMFTPEGVALGDKQEVNAANLIQKSSEFNGVNLIEITLEAKELTRGLLQKTLEHIVRIFKTYKESPWEASYAPTVEKRKEMIQLQAKYIRILWTELHTDLERVGAVGLTRKAAEECQNIWKAMNQIFPTKGVVQPLIIIDNATASPSSLQSPDAATKQERPGDRAMNANGRGVYGNGTTYSLNEFQEIIDFIITQLRKTPSIRNDKVLLVNLNGLTDRKKALAKLCIENVAKKHRIQVDPEDSQGGVFAQYKFRGHNPDFLENLFVSIRLDFFEIQQHIQRSESRYFVFLKDSGALVDAAMKVDDANTDPTAHVLNDQEILVQYLKEKNQQKFWILLDKLKQQGDERLDNLFIKLLIKAPYKTAFLIGLMLINLDSAVRNRIADSLLIEIADAKQVYKSLLRMHNEIYKNEPGGKVMLEIAAIEGLMQVFHTIALFHQEEASMRVRFHEEIANQEPLTPSIIRDLLSLDPQEQAEGLRKAKLLEKIPDSIWQLIATRAYFDEKAQTRDLAKKFLDDAIKQGRHRSKETAMVLKTEQVNLQTVWDQSIRNYLLPILKDFDEFTGSVPDDLLVVLLDHVILAQNMEILDHFYQAKHAIPPGMKDKVEHITSDNLLAQQVAHDFSYNHDINLRFARVLSYLKVSPEAQIMNLGSGTNPVKLSQWPHVLNVDNTEYVALAQHYANFIKAQYARQPGENPYDVVLMHHWGMFGPPRTIPANISFWQKTWKYVKPGGWLVLMIDPNYAVPWEMEKFLGQIQLANMPDLPARVIMVPNDNQSTVRINPYMVIAIQRSSDAAMTGEISRGISSVESRVSKGKTFITHLPVDKAMRVDTSKINEGVRKINAFLLDLRDEEKRNSYLRLMALYVEAPDGTKSWNELNFRDAGLVRKFVGIFYDDPSAFSDFQDIAWFYLSLHSKVAVDQMIDEINGILVSDFDWEGAVSHIEPGAPRDRLYDYLESLRNLFGKGQIPNNPYEKTFRLLLVLVNGEIDLVTERSYLDVDLHQVMGTNNFLEGRQLSYFFYIPIADNLEFFNARLKKFENDTKWKDAIKALRKVLMVPDQAMSALQLTTEDVQAYKKLSKDRSRDYVQEIPKEVLAKKARKDQESALDSAMKGGIDFNPTQMNMQVQGKENSFKFNFNGIDIDAAQVTGVTFTIRQMTPVTDLPAVLGLHAMNSV